MLPLQPESAIREEPGRDMYQDIISKGCADLFSNNEKVRGFIDIEGQILSVIT